MCPPTDSAKPGETYIECPGCHHVQRLLTIPAEEGGQICPTFEFVCSKCQKPQQGQVSDIQLALAHRKQ